MPMQEAMIWTHSPKAVVHLPIWGEPTCICLANKADHRLTPGGFSFLVASFNKDDAKTKELRGKLGVSELMKAGMFMVNTPKECVGETGGN